LTSLTALIFGYYLVAKKSATMDITALQIGELLQNTDHISISFAIVLYMVAQNPITPHPIFHTFITSTLFLPLPLDITYYEAVELFLSVCIATNRFNPPELHPVSVPL
jgi:hypothetical protein